MPIPASLIQVTDLAIGASGVDILALEGSAQLKEDALVLIFANRESVDVTLQLKMGDVEVLPLAGAAVNATLGDIPIIPDDLVLRTLGQTGDRVQVLGTNVNAAAQELRVLVMIIALSDIAEIPALASIGA